MSKEIIIGSGMLLFNNHGEILLAERIGGRWNGFFGAPGGKLDFGETPLQCAIRETNEETGIIVKDPIALNFIATHIFDNKQMIYFWVVATPQKEIKIVDFIEINKDGDPKTKQWKWYSRNEIKKLKLMPSVKYAWDHYIDSEQNNELSIKEVQSF